MTCSGCPNAAGRPQIARRVFLSGFPIVALRRKALESAAHQDLIGDHLGEHDHPANFAVFIPPRGVLPAHPVQAAVIGLGGLQLLRGDRLLFTA